MNEEGFKALAGEDVAGAILSLDLDRFSSLNERFGRTAGDIILREFSRVLAIAVRGDDLIARLEDDAFTVYLRTSSKESAQRVAERIRAMVEERLRVKGHVLTVSVGLAHSSENVPLRSLCQAASDAMLRAKSEGRNKVVTATVGSAVAP